MKTQPNKTLVIPNGSLMEKTLELLRRSGLRITFNGRQAEAMIKGSSLFDKVVLMRPQAIPMAVEKGFAVAGITGGDWRAESGLESVLPVVCELEFGRSQNRSPRIVVISDRTWERVKDASWFTVYAEYPNLARRIFKESQIIFSPGSTEIMIKLGLYNFGVVVADSGRTIDENDLVILDEIMVSPVVFIAKQLSDDLLSMGQVLRGALKAKEQQLFKCNVGREKLGAVVAILPSLGSPTVSNLADGSCSVEAVIGKNEDT